MSFATALSDANHDPHIARRKLVNRLTACLAELDLIGETIAAAHLSACIDALNSGPDLAATAHGDN